MTTRGRRRAAITGVAATLALTVTGCLQDPRSGGSAGPGGSGVANNSQADGDGVVTILGAFGGPEQEAFLDSIADFQEESGIEIQYVPDQDFTTTIQQRVGSGDAPDIGFFPQPGGLLAMAANGDVQPIDTYLDFDSLDRTLIPGLLESSRLNGRVYGAPMRLAVKSIVWYPKRAYQELGLNEEPETLDELLEIAEEIKAQGAAPWCMAWGSDQATGWVGTDWIEEFMLRLHGPDVYDDWTSHRIPFDDPRVIEAFDAYGEIAQTEGNVPGGVRGIISTGFGDAMAPAFRNPPECFLHRQGNFAASFYPEQILADLDNEIGVMVFPPLEDGYAGQPILGGADLAALFNGDDPDSIEVMRFLTSDEFGAEWAGVGGWLSPHTTFDTSAYPDETTRQIAEIASSGDVFRFDGSDLMPQAVGSGTFWRGMIEWLNGDKTAAQVTAEIEASWPVDEDEESDE